MIPTKAIPCDEKLLFGINLGGDMRACVRGWIGRGLAFC